MRPPNRNTRQPRPQTYFYFILRDPQYNFSSTRLNKWFGVSKARPLQRDRYGDVGHNPLPAPGRIPLDDRVCQWPNHSSQPPFARLPVEDRRVANRRPPIASLFLVPWKIQRSTPATPRNLFDSVSTPAKVAKFALFCSQCEWTVMMRWWFTSS
jgi:hypothetical protein